MIRIHLEPADKKVAKKKQGYSRRDIYLYGVLYEYVKLVTKGLSYEPGGRPDAEACKAGLAGCNNLLQNWIHSYES